jgi:hypothetical protein
MDTEDEMKRRAMDIEDKMKKAMGENVYAFMNSLKVVYGYHEDENEIADINLTDKERNIAIEFLMSILKEMGIEKTCKVMQKMLGRKRFNDFSTRSNNSRCGQVNCCKQTKLKSNDCVLIE